MSWRTSAVLFFLGVPVAVYGHHSLVAFDRDRFEEIDGEITRLGWRNPHLTVDVRATAADGSVQTWQIEGDAINTLMRRGLTREDLAVGNAVRFGGFPSSRGRRELMPTNVLLPDGREVVMVDADLPLRWTTPPRRDVGDRIER